MNSTEIHNTTKTSNNKALSGIILASASPRRAEIMHSHGIYPVIIPTSTDETLPADIGMTDAVEMLASRKALACYESVQGISEYSGHVIVGADTIVWKDEIMGKPVDHDDAFRMLDKIRGTVHYVVTGVALIDVDTRNLQVLSDITEVHCKDYSDEDIEEYLSMQEPYDKAGSYAIQGYFGRYIDHIDGDYENVVGLPFYRIEPFISKYV